MLINQQNVIRRPGNSTALEHAAKRPFTGGLYPGNCVHEVMTGIGGRLNEAKNKAGVGFMAERNIRARMTCLRRRT